MSVNIKITPKRAQTKTTTTRRRILRNPQTLATPLGKVRAWLYTLPLALITTWDELSHIFLKRHKDLLIKCPYHGLEKWLVVQVFYSRLNYNGRIVVDTTASSALMKKSVDEAYELIEGITQNYTMRNQTSCSTESDQQHSQPHQGFSTSFICEEITGPSMII